MTRHTHQIKAFTLLELVVVVAIIAIATAILIPAIASVRSAVGDVTCQNNLRQLLTALDMYNTDNNGSMPYGIYYVGSGPPTWAPPPGGNGEYVSWVSELNQYFNSVGLAPQFRCPDAQQQVGPHPVSYVMNFIVAVTPYYELFVAQPPYAQTKPPRVSLLLREGTALVWDTAIRADLLEDMGYLVGSDIDVQAFWFYANYPQRRYFNPADPYAQSPNPALRRWSLNAPVVFGSPWSNIDPPAGTSYYYQGNLRFRHNKQTQCNVAYSDGSVRRFTAIFNPDLTMRSHDARRRNFMIHWPPETIPGPDPFYGPTIGALRLRHAQVETDKDQHSLPDDRQH